METRRWSTVGLVWVGLMAVVAGFISLPLNFGMEEVVSGLEIPTDFAFMPEGQTSKVLVLEKLGQVFLIEDGVRQPELFLDIRHLVNSAQDRGCLGLAVDLDFDNGQRYIYISYVYENNPDDVTGKKSARVSRFTVNEAATSADVDSEVILMGSVTNAGCGGGFDTTQDIICVDSTHHAGGGIQMASDRTIYFATGDGASVGNPGNLGMRCQYPENNIGKIFRVDRDGNGLEDNPFYDGNPKSNPSRMWALGFRQPFRLQVDEQLPGCVWVADTGRVDYEEVNLVCRGDNHEWPCLEGVFEHETLFGTEPECKDMYDNVEAGESAAYVGVRRQPSYMWDRSQGTAAVGAARMQLPEFPAEYQGAVFAMDYSADWLRFFHVDEFGERIDGPFEFASEMKGPVQLREGSDGCLWYLSLITSALFKICYSQDLSIPTISKVSPPNLLQNVETSVMIEVTVSKRITPESAATSVVVQSQSGEDVEGTVTYDATIRRIRFDPTESLAMNTWYSITISGLTDFYGTEMAGPVVRQFKTGEGFTVFLSNLPILESYNGHATRPVLADKTKWQTPISQDGVVHEKGFGVVPEARVCVEVPAGCSRLLGDVAVDDVSFNLDGGALIFHIVLDNVKVWDSEEVYGGVLTQRGSAISHNVNVEGGTVVCLDCINGGWANLLQNVGSWGSTRYRCGAFDAIPPVILDFSISPVNESGAANVKPSVTIIFSEPMDEVSLFESTRIYAKEQGTTISWIPDMNGELTEMMIEVSTLQYGTEYCVIVSTVAKDLVGNKMESEFESCFTTVEQPKTGMTIDVMEELVLRQVNDEGTFDPSGFPRTLAPGSQIFGKGLGMKAWSQTVWDVSELQTNQGCNRVRATIGVDKSVNGPDGKCTFEVTKSYATAVMLSKEMAPQQISESIEVAIPWNGRFRLRALVGSDGNKGDYCNYADARLMCENDVEIYLSDLDPLSSGGKVFYDENAKGQPMELVIPHNTYQKGFMVTPEAKIRVNIPRSSCSKLRLTFGIDDANAEGSMHILVKVPGRTNCYSGVFRTGDGAKTIECDVTNGEYLTIVAKDGFDGSGAGDIALVANLELDCATTVKQPKCDITGLPDSFVVGDLLQFNAVATNYAGTTLAAENVSWLMKLVHCQPLCHQHPDQPIENTLSAQYLVPDHGDYFYVSIECRVTDENGTSVTEASVFPETAEVSVVSSPAGEQIVIASISRVAPFSTSVVVGSSFNIIASAISEDGLWEFSRWEHDENAGREFTVESIKGDVTYTAVYDSSVIMT